MSTILKALRRLEEDNPPEADPSRNASLGANLPATDPRAAGALRDRILAEENAARATRATSRSDDPESAGPRRAILGAAFVVALAVGAGLYWITAGDASTPNDSTATATPTPNDATATATPTETATARNATEIARTTPTDPRESPSRIAATTRPATPTNAESRAALRERPSTRATVDTRIGVPASGAAVADDENRAAERALASALAVHPSGGRVVVPAPSGVANESAEAETNARAMARAKPAEAADEEGDAETDDQPMEIAAVTPTTAASASVAGSARSAPRTPVATEPVRSRPTVIEAQAAPVEAQPAPVEVQAASVESQATPVESQATPVESRTASVRSASQPITAEPPRVSAPAVGKPAPEADEVASDGMRSAEPSPSPEPAPRAAPSGSRPASDPAPRPSETVATRVQLPDLSVVRTTWHPDASRRSARIRLEANDKVLTLREGDAVGGLVIQEISPSAVVFQSGEVEIRRRVGQGVSRN